MKTISNLFKEVKRHCISDSPKENLKNLGFCLFSTVCLPIMIPYTGFALAAEMSSKSNSKERHVPTYNMYEKRNLH